MSGLNQRFAKPPTSAMGSASSNLAPSAIRVDGVNGSMLVSKTKGLCSNRSRCAILRISVMVAQVTLDDLVLVRIQYPQLKNVLFLLKIF